MHCPINDHCTLVMVLSNTQSLFWIWASKLLLWRRFDFAFLGQKKKTEMGMVDFSFSSQKVWNLDVSISSRIMRFVCKISLSLLETRENIFGFLFSSRNWRKCLKFLHFFGKNSRSLLEPENRSRHFSFLLSKFEIWIPYFSFSSWFHFSASRQCLGEAVDYARPHLFLPFEGVLSPKLFAHLMLKQASLVRDVG